MFTVYHSNKVDTLKIILVHLIKSNPLANPFDKEQILVQSPGMSQWLKMELAKEFGVAANIDFPLPATFIWEMFTQVLPDVPKRSAFNKETMTWKLMSILPAKLDHPDFLPLQRYLENDTDSSKLYQLAEKIADIFDGYLVYRPEWMAAWEAGENVAELQGADGQQEHPWQPILWQALYKQTLSQGQSKYHRGNLYHDFIEALSQQKGQLSHLPKRLFVFGISSLPPRYIDALKVMGEHIDVHLMFTNPCQHYWGDIRDRKYLARVEAQRRKQFSLIEGLPQLEGEVSPLKDGLEANVEDEFHTSQAVGNSLLASMGKLGRDNLFLLSQSESEEHEFFIDIKRDSLLHQLQADILELEEHQNDHILDSSEHKQSVVLGDRSLMVHVCHSPMREVEVLHDQLLAMFDADPTLKPRDIIVMVADINAYSPAIQAVFGNAPGERFIPYSISDRTADQESPILAAFMQLVNLPNTRCLASELLELLETPAILKRFELSEDDFLQAKQWVEESGIRWGLDANTGREFELPETRQNTWQFGIQRMLLGYAMPESAGLFETEQGSLSPYNEVQGMGAELAGKLAHFIQQISTYRSKLSHVQTIDGWRETLVSLLDDFFSVELEGEIALKSIRDTLSQLKEQLADAAFDDALLPSIISQYLQSKLSGTRVSQRFLAGQVNFCTLMPMRSIPFRTVCLLGMNDGVYPPSDPVESFNLMEARAKIGDRSRRVDSRYLFLEAMLSAQQTLYISYVGRSIQDNTERVPSVLVSELMEYCHQNYCLSGDEALPVDESGDNLLNALVNTHAMVPFSPSAFQGMHASYAKEWIPAALTQSSQSQGYVRRDFNRALDDYLLGATFPLELDLVELQRFWRLPVQYFFNRRLKVIFEPPLPVMEDDEPFVLGGLESYQMRDELLEILLETTLMQPEKKTEVLKHFMSQQRAQGKLPVGAFGDIEFETNRVQAEELVDKLAFLSGAPQDDLEIDLTFDSLFERNEGEEKNVRLAGWLTQCYQSGLIRYRSGKIRSQDYLAAWIDHLAMSASGHAKKTHIIGYDRKEGALHLIYPEIADAQYAKQLLTELVRLFFEGMTKPLPYFPKTALACVEAGFSRGQWVDDEEKSLKKMADAFNDGFMSPGEGSNAYISRIWPAWNDELASEVRLLTALVLQGVRLAVQDADDVKA
ncbi:RecBCD enzyme subunit RecC [Vibrio alginolyticus]|uniref:RecBCD enzyme subunit RecC n=3 Tax=Vibrio TaxID=662 RepID=A0A1W6U9A6_VIBAL|nr:MULTISPECIES: exodeoxyribonuclease V subunit gamma [Vibrio]NAW52886.1 exodeoxyribonuclease V subunit gamma [Vibrio sp. V41_P2S12T139]ARO99411.1 RecBCD enzyme subunit RecC [Vibrio alginolyticus]ARP04127.1 RecBCD enzyme subunit RecC [Vibrio alginolyticus]ARP09185.1 RecBCD enzyme subunit RecC [Vibrio alginolyticus]ARP14262.1 RecBCD enzyme subunit RecC [Vibrio alginolyticus]